MTGELDEVRRRAGMPYEVLRTLATGARSEEDTSLGSRARAVTGTLRWMAEAPDETPLNAEIGPHRRFDWLAMELADIRTVREGLGGSLNDVVLATVAGAVRLAREIGPGKTIVTMLCDYGTRYQSKIFNPAFLRERDLPVPDWLEPAAVQQPPEVFEPE